MTKALNHNDLRSCTRAKSEFHHAPNPWTMKCAKCHSGFCFAHMAWSTHLHSAEAFLAYEKDPKGGSVLHSAHLASSKRYSSEIAKLRLEAPDYVPNLEVQLAYLATNFPTCRPVAANSKLWQSGHYDLQAWEIGLPRQKTVKAPKFAKIVPPQPAPPKAVKRFVLDYVLMPPVPVLRPAKRKDRTGEPAVTAEPSMVEDDDAPLRKRPKLTEPPRGPPGEPRSTIPEPERPAAGPSRTKHIILSKNTTASSVAAAFSTASVQFTISATEAKQALVSALVSSLHPHSQPPLATSENSLGAGSLHPPESLFVRLAPTFLLLSWVPHETLGSFALNQFTVESFENYTVQSIMPNLESKEFWAASNLNSWLCTRGKDHYNMIYGEHFSTRVLQRVQSMRIALPPTVLPKNLLPNTYCLLLQCPPDAHPIHSGASRFLAFIDQYQADLDALVTLLRKCKWSTKIRLDARRGLSAKVCKHMAHDISVMVAELVLSLRDREFLASPGARAQNFLDLLQDVSPHLCIRRSHSGNNQVLDLDIFSAVKPLIAKALLRLCRESGLYPRCFALTGLEIVGEQVAAGGFGDIWKGLIRTQAVCVKVMRLFQKADIEALLKEFGREALIWRQLCHPNLLPSRLCLVSPWMENGNVMEFLKNEPPNTNHRLSLILDVALGLDYLRNQNVVHGDLKAINILVTPSRRACIADFGLAHIASTMTLRFAHSTSNVRGGTMRYLAPELFKPSPRHFGSDVYAFASTCYEIMTGKVTFHELRNDMTVMLAVLEGKHPSRPQSWTSTPALDGLWDLLQTCWCSQPEERPSARQIVQQLEDLSIPATAASSTRDWDEKFTSKFRRGLQDRPLLPLATQLEETLFGGGD
ncbi:hypothetical protein K438DRAFT_1922282, partial [Mycena galopus ATCC 62051]